MHELSGYFVVYKGIVPLKELGSWKEVYEYDLQLGECIIYKWHSAVKEKMKFTVVREYCERDV